MHYYFAPMEGLTDRVFRRLHHQFFPGVDRYYMPFFSPTIHRQLTAREQLELPRADSVGFSAIPQVLTKVAEDFVWMAQVCQDLGYPEINLNMGCPSGTVVAKGKGSGMLKDPASLDRFLAQIFANAPLPISIKTRIGMESAEEFPAILEIYNRYPIRELIIHPRLRSQFYSGKVDMDAFSYAVENSANPLCYNGDIRSLDDVRTFQAQYPQVPSIMIGRGLLADPGMLSSGTNIDKLEAFMDALLDSYLQEFGGSRNAMFRLKEHWSYLFSRYPDCEKLWKQLRKTTDLSQYQAITRAFFAKVRG